MLWGGCTALAAGWKPGGVVVGIAFVALVVAGAVRWRTVGGRAIGALTAPLLFAVLTAITRLGVVPHIPPDEFRYRWTIAAGLVLAAVSLWRTDRPAPSVTAWPRLQQAGLALGVVLAVAGAVVLVRDSQEWTDTVVAAAPGLRAELFAAEATRGSTPADHVLPLSYVPVTQGEYLDAIDDVGSPLEGLDPATFGGSEDHRRSADRLLADALERHASDFAGNATTCVAKGPHLQVPPGTLVRVDSTDSTVQVRLARFSTDGVAVTTVDRPDGRYLSIPEDAPGTPRYGPDYRVVTTPPTGESVCG
jgi:hypothetical protein